MIISSVVILFHIKQLTLSGPNNKRSYIQNHIVPKCQQKTVLRISPYDTENLSITATPDCAARVRDASPWTFLSCVFLVTVFAQGAGVAVPSVRSPTGTPSCCSKQNRRRELSTGQCREGSIMLALGLVNESGFKQDDT